MLSKAAIAALRDIEHHIGLANQFVVGLDYERFVEGRLRMHLGGPMRVVMLHANLQTERYFQSHGPSRPGRPCRSL